MACWLRVFESRILWDRVMFDFLISQALHGADVRMLACRSFPDPRERGYSKASVSVNGRLMFLCPRRVEAFLADEPRSLAGLACVPCVSREPDAH